MAGGLPPVVINKAGRNGKTAEVQWKEFLDWGHYILRLVDLLSLGDGPSRPTLPTEKGHYSCFLQSPGLLVIITCISGFYLPRSLLEQCEALAGQLPYGTQHKPEPRTQIDDRAQWEPIHLLINKSICRGPYISPNCNFLDEKYRFFFLRLNSTPESIQSSNNCTGTKLLVRISSQAIHSTALQKK